MTDDRSVCLHCGRTSDEVGFPMGRPRKDGTRHPMAYCVDCFTVRAMGLNGGGREALRRAQRNHKRRVAYARWGYVA